MAKVEDLLESIDSLTVVELAELVKSIEEKYGVSAVAAAPASLTTKHAMKPRRTTNAPIPVCTYQKASFSS